MFCLDVFISLLILTLNCLTNIWLQPDLSSLRLFDDLPSYIILDPNLKLLFTLQEDMDDLQSVISGLEQSVSQLELAMKIGTISASHRNRLKTASSKLASLINNLAS